jgi:amino-acid N-acetyltransferase
VTPPAAGALRAPARTRPPLPVLAALPGAIVAAVAARAPAGGDAAPLAAPVAAPVVLIRAARPADAAAVYALLAGYARQGLLLPRTLEQVRERIRSFVVALDGQGIAGCAALRLHSPVLAEVCAVAVAERAQGCGVGRTVVEAVVADARRAGARRAFALTLQVPFFHRLGFRTTAVAEFPEKIAADCARCASRHHCMETAVVRDLD